MIKAIIVENEKPQSDYLEQLLSKHFPEVEVLAVCDNVPDGISKVKSLHPQLIFLDVELSPYTGFELLEKTREQSYEVVFTTSFNKYAMKAIKFCALDFIEKPFGADDLKEAMERYKAKSATGSAKHIHALLNNINANDRMGEQVGIPILGGYEFIKVADIIRCQSANNYTEFYLTEKKKITATKTLKWVDELLSDHLFFRTHDSHLINLNHIKTYRKGGEGGIVLLTDKHEVDVSRRKKDDFLKILADKKMIASK
jgi:two-component system LytT family response regulator